MKMQQTPEEPGPSTGTWTNAEAYELYIGRWSRLAARHFVDWLAPPKRALWLEVGCGTGALSEAVLETAEPAWVIALDRSDSYVSFAQQRLQDRPITFVRGDAQDLQFLDGQFAMVVSSLMLNFLADPPRAVNEMARVARPGGTVAAYIWDYAEGMGFLRALWAEAFAIDPTAIRFDEGHRSALRNDRHLAELFTACGLAEVATREIIVPTRFPDFDAYWAPFLGGQGTVAGYVARLEPDHREELRQRLRRKLIPAGDGEISFTARAWAVRGRRR